MSTRTPARRVDAVIVGGGPAGAAAARFLASWGRSVALLTRARRPGIGLAESVPPSSRKILDELGASSRLDAASFLPARGNTVWWGSRKDQRTDFPDGAGWQVERQRLDDLLLDLARQAGVEVLPDARAAEVAIGPDEVRVRARTGGRGGPADVELAGAFVLDCSGRSGLLASRGGRTTSAVRTMALVGAWRKPGGWGLPDETHTLVESYPGGWAWSIPVSPELRYFTAMVDPDVTAIPRGADVEAAYRAELAKTIHLRRLLDGAGAHGTPWACAATPYASARPSGPRHLLVGDASSFIDPLSSFGVKKALASAWLAAVAVNTLLDDAAALEPAVRHLYDGRERLAFESYGARAAAMYREGWEAHALPFWARRLEAAAGGNGAGSGRHEAGGAEPGEDEAAALRQDPRVWKAFSDLRNAPAVALRAGGAPEIRRGPAVRGRKVVLEPRLHLPAYGEGIRYLRQVDLVRLTEVVGAKGAERSWEGAEGWDVPDLYEAYTAEVGPAPLPDFLGGLAVLLAEGLVENAAEAHSSGGARRTS